MSRTIASTLAAILLLGGIGLVYLDGAAAETRQLRASRAEVGRMCEDAGGTFWGGEAAPPEDGRYGCIASSAWIQCDRFGNCVGGNGAAQRFGDPARRRGAAGG